MYIGLVKDCWKNMDISLAIRVAAAPDSGWSDLISRTNHRQKRCHWSAVVLGQVQDVLHIFDWGGDGRWEEGGC